jgi:cyclophilin family peptidyl-prolyl cis-trans isomerase
MPSRARDKQLAKLAARRQAERNRRKRRRDLTLGVIGVVVALVIMGVGAKILLGGDDTTAAASGSATPSATTSPTLAAKLGTQTGTVQPKPAPTTVACDGNVPPGAGKPKPQFAGPPPMRIDPKNTYTATMATSCGTITIELDPTRAPETVNSFVFLARKGFFDGQFFTRLDTSIDVIQGGDPTETGGGGPGYNIPDEVKGDESYVAGTFAMAKGQAPNSGGSQFFIISGPNGSSLDARPVYTIFGHITEGLDVARMIQKLPVMDPKAAAGGDITAQEPTQAVYMNSVTITES